MNDSNNVLRIPLKIKMKDGQDLNGNLLVTIGGQIERTLNSEALFISFEDEAGQRFIAKSSISEVIPVKRQRQAA